MYPHLQASNIYCSPAFHLQFQCAGIPCAPVRPKALQKLSEEPVLQLKSFLSRNLLQNHTTRRSIKKQNVNKQLLPNKFIMMAIFQVGKAVRYVHSASLHCAKTE